MPVTGYCMIVLVDFTTGAHLAISVAMNSAALVGDESDSGSRPSPSRSALNEADFMMRPIAPFNTSITADGVLAGARRIPDVEAAMPGTVSAAAGMSGAIRDRFSPVIASTRSVPCRWKGSVLLNVSLRIGT